MNPSTAISVPYRAVRPDFVVVSTPILHFLPCGVKAREPMGVQAFAFEFAVERPNETVVGRHARPREIQHDALLVRPDVEIAGDKLRSLIDAERLGKPTVLQMRFGGRHNILASIAKSHVDGW